ncbi:MAG: hypothetical protein ACYTDY_07460 [Planctomycetota bacterium]|jgi:hypothetical protein
MNNETGRTLGILLALVTAIALAEGVLLIRLESRVGDIEERSLTGSGDEMTPLALGDEMWELREKMDGFEEKQQVTSKAMTAWRKSFDSRLARVEKAVPGAGRLDPGAARAALDSQSVEKTVARMLDEKLKDRPQHQGGEWKPTLQQFKETLDLSEEQTTKSEQILDDAKHEAFRLLSTKRDDGTSKLDDLVGAMKAADPEAEMKRIFTSLFTEKIPGREETYIAEVLRIKVRAQNALDDVLDADQRKTLSRMNLDHLGVHTSYDPFAEYIQDSIR